MIVEALILGGATVTAAPTEQSDWQWDKETQICALRQQLTPPAERIEISRTPGSIQTGIGITTKSLGRVPRGRLDGFIELSTGERSKADVYEYAEYGKLQVNAVTHDATFMQKFANAQTVRISHGDTGGAQVTIRSSSAADVALRTCEDKKMTDWGIDPVALRSLKSGPIPITSLADRFSDLDYPTDALTFLVTGDAVTRLDIGSDGSVTRCKSLNASQYKGFEYATCNLLKGARFEPALNSAGQPVAAPYVIDVAFRIAR